MTPNPADLNLKPVSRVARALNVSPDTVRRLIEQGDLTAFRVRRQYQVDWHSVLSYLKRAQV